MRTCVRVFVIAMFFYKLLNVAFNRYIYALYSRFSILDGMIFVNKMPTSLVDLKEVI